MTRDRLEELDPGEEDALTSLKREVPPPDHLEDRTVAALRAHGLLGEGAGGTRSPLPRIAGLATAALLLVVAGVATGRWTNPAPEAAEPDFILLLRAGPDEAQAIGEAELMHRVREYSTWARSAGETGSVLGGEKLTDTGQLMSWEQAESATVEPLVPREGSVQGFFLIRSDSLADAMQVAAGCPHLKYGGRIELRRIERFDTGEERS